MNTSHTPTMTATYSPDDNKLRLYSSSRLDSETYTRVRAAGFIWAPKQELFVAPAWTPERADLLVDLCGEIGDEDTSLVDRAEARAERFEGYSERRAQDADHAHDAVRAIADNIPFGQPILVGHHSERHARKDAERIENGMRKAVRMWETSSYWDRRAKGALAHAKYLEKPAVRARRIKTLDADKRKQERNKAEAELNLKLWTKEGLTQEQARLLAGRIWLNVAKAEGHYWTAYDVLRPDDERGSICPAMTVEEVVNVAKRVYPRTISHADRWIAHLDLRIAYERAMLGEQGGLKGESFSYEVGGQVQRRGQWFVICKINKRAGAVSSLGVIGHFASTITLDEVQDYQPPREGDTEKIKKQTATPPLCNYPGEGFLHLTKAEYEAGVPKWSEFPKVGIIKATETTGRHRIRQTKGENFWNARPVYITDAKRVDPPAVTAPAPAVERIQSEPQTPAATPAPQAPSEQDETFRAMREQLRNGQAVQVVSAPQLFPTPAEIAERMVELAEIEPGMIVLEPSAGTGAIVKAVIDAVDTEIVAYEINRDLTSHLSRTFPCYRLQARCQDFLEVTEGMGQFDRVVMNPPFENAVDVKHIRHAMKMLRPGGILVALCAAGPRQAADLQPIAETWEVLPSGSFRESGTGVNVALLTFRAKAA